MPTVKEKFEKTIERWGKRSIEEIRNETIDETRKKLEQKGESTNVYSEFPFIGRGTVQRDVISHRDVEKELDKFLNG